jgi:voltage-gated potassium channel
MTALAVRERTFSILEMANSGDRVSKTCDVCIIGLILLNVFAVILETVKSLSAKYGDVFFAIEAVSITIFATEYILRIWSCTAREKYRHPVMGRLRFATTPMAIIDLLAIIPLQGGAFRLLRMLRLAKLVRYSRSLQTIVRVFKKKASELVATAAMAAMLLVGASSLLYFVERSAQPEQFSSIPATMWWAVGTLTTVGYGDIYPITTLGKILGAVVAFLGISFFALPTGILGAAFVDEVKKLKKRPTCPHCGGECE